ncbi:putative holin-like toxin [Paenibacillus cineris]
MHDSATIILLNLARQNPLMFMFGMFILALLTYIKEK